MDLLASTKDIGILCDAPFPQRIACAIFDRAEHALSFEFGDAMDSLRCNVTIDDMMADRLAGARTLMIGVVKKGKLASVEQVRLITLDVAAHDDD